MIKIFDNGTTYWFTNSCFDHLINQGISPYRDSKARTDSAVLIVTEQNKQIVILKARMDLNWYEMLDKAVDQWIKED